MRLRSMLQSYSKYLVPSCLSAEDFCEGGTLTPNYDYTLSPNNSTAFASANLVMAQQNSSPVKSVGPDESSWSPYPSSSAPNGC